MMRKPQNMVQALLVTYGISWDQDHEIRREHGIWFNVSYCPSAWEVLYLLMSCISLLALLSIPATSPSSTLFCFELSRCPILWHPIGQPSVVISSHLAGLPLLNNSTRFSDTLCNFSSGVCSVVGYNFEYISDSILLLQY